MGASYLPANATHYEQALANACAYEDVIAELIDRLKTIKLVSPPPSLLPFLIYEYGLGELTPYVPNLYELIREGRQWQKIRGTPAALSVALGWLDYQAVLEEANPDLIYWNMFQLALDHVFETLDELEQIEGVARLSSPKRSTFWRGYHGYDVRAMQPSLSTWDGMHFADHSGIRLRAPRDQEDVPTQWSFGQRFTFQHRFTQAELEALGVWRDEVPALSPSWEEAIVSWEEADFTWLDHAQTARAQAIMADIRALPVFVVFYDGEGQTIGARRITINRFVSADPAGVYEHDGVRYQPSNVAQSQLYMVAHTDFGDGAGKDSSHIRLGFDLQTDEGLPPYQLWFEADEFSGGTEAGEQVITLKHSQPVRQRMAFLLSV